MASIMAIGQCAYSLFLHAGYNGLTSNGVDELIDQSILISVFSVQEIIKMAP